MTDSQPESAADQPRGAANSDNAKTSDESAEVVFTKAPQPELPLAERKKKAGMNRNRIGIWIVVGGFGTYMIITGVIGILTKAR